MARITCAISGIRFNCSYLDDISIPHTEGYFHPIFALPYRNLHRLYTKHCHGELTSNDSYLLFIAFLHSSGKIRWEHPAALNPNDSSTKKLIENNLAQLITVLEKSALIKHPGFKQPSFKVTYEVSNLSQIPNWVEAWENNIAFFNRTTQDIRTKQSLQAVENKLGDLILSGKDPSKFSHVIAAWASQAAEFPPDKDEEWQKVIRSCFNISKMFNTPLSLLKEIKDYCECNIQAGSIHFHTLCTVLKEGISRHVDYLGGSSLALGYTMLPALNKDDLTAIEKEKKNAAELLVLASKATSEPPREVDYPNQVDFLKAKLAYRVAKNQELRELRKQAESESKSEGNAL